MNEEPSQAPNETAPVIVEEKRIETTPKHIPWGIAALVGAALVVAGAAYFFYGGSFPDGQDTDESIVIRVNGEGITQTEYAMRLEQVSMAAVVQGFDPANAEVAAEIKTAAVDGLVAERLLLQEANNAGITVTDAEVDGEIAKSRAQFPDEATFNDELAKNGLTMEKLREVLRKQIIVQRYIVSRVNLAAVVATEEEVKALYDQAAETTEDLPALETVRPQIEQQIIAQKQQRMVADLVADLRSSSQVEILL